MAILYITTQTGEAPPGIHTVDINEYVTNYAALPADLQPSGSEMQEYLASDVQSRLAVEPIGEDVVLVLDTIHADGEMRFWEELATACNAQIERI